MTTKVLYIKNARRDIKKLEKKEAVKIASKILFYSEQDDPLKYAKRLKPPFDDLYRFRIGTYRAIFKIDKNGAMLLLIILRV